MSPKKHTLPSLTGTVAAVLALSACSDTKTPNDVDFRKALEPVMRDIFCRTIPIQRMSLNDNLTQPFPIIVPVAPVEGADPDDARSRTLVEEAARDGLLTRTELNAPAKRADFTLPLTRQALISYTPTDRSKAYFRPVEAKTSSGMRAFPGVCAAKGDIVDVVRWTEPADALGRTVSQVTFTYRGVEPLPGLPENVRSKITQPEERTVIVPVEMLLVRGRRAEGPHAVHGDVDSGFVLVHAGILSNRQVILVQQGMGCFAPRQPTELKVQVVVLQAAASPSQPQDHPHRYGRLLRVGRTAGCARAAGQAGRGRRVERAGRGRRRLL